jgi:putative flippase GtrA
LEDAACSLYTRFNCNLPLPTKRAQRKQMNRSTDNHGRSQRSARETMKLFLGFVLVSGVGWMLDLLSYTGLNQVAGLPAGYANFISSMVGVTYVWMVALNRLFGKGDYGKSIFLPIYWGYQAASILGYSILISLVVAAEFNIWLGQLSHLPPAVIAKILLTAPNLMTNFVFMSFLTKFMKTDTHRQILK